MTTCEACHLPVDPVAMPVHPTCEAGWVRPWPPPGFRLARGVGPAAAEFEAHMAKARAIENGWQQRPRGKR